jgi:hypothetical protein
MRFIYTVATVHHLARLAPAHLHTSGDGTGDECDERLMKIQLVLYDAVDHNKVSIRQLTFIFFLTHYMFRPLQAILKRDIQLDIC